MVRLVELRSKEVINLSDGYRLGYVYDCEVDLEEGKIISIIVLGESRFFGLFGRENDYVIEWNQVKKVGDDVILVEYSMSSQTGRKGRSVKRLDGNKN